MLCIDSLVAVVVEAVVAAQCSKSTQSDGIGEEDLSAGINPHLSRREMRDNQYASWYPDADLCKMLYLCFTEFGPVWFKVVNNPI